MSSWAKPPGLDLVDTLVADAGWLHLALRWRADDEDKQVALVSCWFPGRFGSKHNRVIIATSVREDRYRALDPLPGHALETLRSLSDAPGDLPDSARHDGTAFAMRGILRIQVLPLTEVEVVTVIEELERQLDYAARVIDAIEEGDLLHWAARRISCALDAIVDHSPPEGWEEDTGRLIGFGHLCAGGRKERAEGKPQVYACVEPDGIMWRIEHTDVPKGVLAKRKQVLDHAGVEFAEGGGNLVGTLLDRDALQAHRDAGDAAGVEQLVITEIVRLAELIDPT